MWCGAALSCLLSVPQAVRVLRAERLDGISAATYVIVLSNAAVWAAWALLTSEYAAGVPGLINGPAAILILRRLMITRRKRRNYKSESSLLVRAPGNGNVSATRGVLAGPVAGQSKQHHDAEPEGQQAGRKGDDFRSISVAGEAGMVITTQDSINTSRAQGARSSACSATCPCQFSRYPPSGAPRHGLVSVPIATDPDSSSMLRTDSAVAPLQAAGPEAC